MTARLPSPAWKITMATMSVAARLKANACASLRDIVPAPVLEAGDHPPRDRRQMCQAEGRNHRAGAAAAASGAHKPHLWGSWPQDPGRTKDKPQETGEE